MLPYNSKFSGIFKRAPNIKSGETYDKYTMLGKMSTGHPDSPIAEILMPIKGKLMLLCDDWAEIKKGDVFAEIEIIPE
jgi:hypothetical protein